MKQLLRASRRVVPGATLAALPATLMGCSLIYDLAPEQCKTTEDCVALGGAFADRVCEQNVCVVNQPTGCTSNTQCMDDPRFFGDPALCVERECVALKSPDCPVVLPVTRELWRSNLASDNPLVLGGFATITTELIGMQLRNYDLALTELTDKLGGLPASGGARRPVVMVVCRANFTERANLDAAMQHLSSTVRTPGIVSALLADDLQYAFESSGLAANMFFMSPLESDSTLMTLPDDGLVWHVGPGGDYVARAYAPLLTRTLAYLNPAGSVRVATVVASDLRYLSDVANTVQSSVADGGLVFNGKSVSENLTEGNYKPISITSSYTDPNVQLTDQITELLAFRPHVILAAAADEFLAQVVPALERGWVAGPENQPKPFYLLSPYHYNNPELGPLLASFPEVRQRIVGINGPSAEDQTLYNRYQIAFDAAWPEVAGRRGYENFYDAAYYLLYAAAGAGNLLVSGQDMKRGMTRLLSGTSFDMGPTDMSQAIQALQFASISLQGTLGAPNFDPNTGARQGLGTAWCIDGTGQQRSDVLRYNESTGAWTGTFPCFSGF